MKKIETDVLIIGAGPVGLFSVFELGQLNIKSCLVDSLEEIGGQCTALYPEKPIYDIPAYPEISAKSLIEKLDAQIKPFNPDILLNQKVEKLSFCNSEFNILTSSEVLIKSKCVIIAAGNGSFGPNKPPIMNIGEFENKSVFYSVKDKSKFKGSNVCIAGGGDSAVDWAIELSEITNMVYFIHRRNKLRAAPSNVTKLLELEKKGKVEMVIPYQLDSIIGSNGKIDMLVVRDLENNIKNIKADFFLPFFGLSNELGPIKEWELDIEKKGIVVEQSTCETNKEGIFAIGDICQYPGKLKLILTGFSEAAIAAHQCYKKVFPDKHLHFEYSTTKGINNILS